MTDNTNARRPRRPAVFWLIVKKGAGQEEVLTLELDDEGEALPVFGFEDEARMFLSLGTLGAGWQPKEIPAGKLKEMLLGPCAGVGLVSLDPLPELVYQRMVSLVNVRREQFVERLIEKEEKTSTLTARATSRAAVVRRQRRLERRPTPLF